MKLLLSLLLSLISNAAIAQWQVPDHSVPIGRGAGTGFKSAGPCQSGHFVGGTGTTTDPTCQSPLAPIVYIKDPAFGAVCDGSADDTIPIQNAINALPVTGGTVLFPAANCKITSSLTIGNGTSSTASTRIGVVLRGVGNSNTHPGFAGFTATTGPKITYAGSASNSIITVNGPLQGWGVQNLHLDCAGVASVSGITVISAAFGDSRDITLNNCAIGIASTTVAPFGSFTNTDSIRNTWYNTTIRMPNASGAIGILLTGVAAGTSNTDYNTFINTDISPTTSNTLNYGIYLQSTDSVHFYNTHIYGGSASAQCVAFDYTLATSFPSSTRFMGIDTNGDCGGGAGSTINGTPSSVNARPNIIYPDGANNTTCANFTMLNVSCFSYNEAVVSTGPTSTGVDLWGVWQAFTPSPSCGTATITTNSARRKTMGKTTFIEVDFTITVLGTCTTNLGFNLPNTTQGRHSLVGQETDISGNTASCQMSNTTASTCQRSGAAWTVNNRFVATGVYENQ